MLWNIAPAPPTVNRRPPPGRRAGLAFFPPGSLYSRPMLTQLVPRQVFFTKGVGRHRDKLRSFEIALRGAGIEKCNLVSVSSILPPGCHIIAKSQGIKRLKPG